MKWLQMIGVKRAQPKRLKKAQVKTATSIYDAVPMLGAAPVVAPQYRQLSDRKDGQLGMVGYAPIVKVTKYRWLCEYCLEPLKKAERHVCWGNIETHIDTATPEEKAKVLAQLQELGPRIGQAIRRAQARAKLVK